MGKIEKVGKLKEVSRKSSGAVVQLVEYEDWKFEGVLWNPAGTAYFACPALQLLQRRL